MDALLTAVGWFIVGFALGSILFRPRRRRPAHRRVPVLELVPGGVMRGRR